jgi:DNA polymerase-3 subunit gamma/tau
MVRFLRNTMVAKVAGADSSLLQISSDERKRVARVAEWFSEEDLARHLQIMLRTHGELGYRQEQRFHLELGLLKMAHAQRLLPLEQLLSEAGVASAPPAASKPTMVEPRRSESPAARLNADRPNNVSPFAADSARKGSSKPELSAEANPSAGPRVVGGSGMASVVMGAAAPATPQPSPEVLPESKNDPESQAPEQDPLREAVLNALAGGGHRMLAAMLAAGEWQVAGNELEIKVASSETVIDMSLGTDAKRLAIATASGVLGRPVKLKVAAGADSRSAGPVRAPANGGGRSRAEQDPIVRRMREKFGAEIRTIIDYREKR